MRVLVTRPSTEAAAWVSGLTAAGHDAVALPLIDISPVGHSADALLAWQALPTCQAVMFVSAAAVKHFFAMVHSQGQPHLPSLRYWATGLGTRKALLQAGVPQALIDSPDADAGQFDSEALWRVVAQTVVPHRPVLIVRGTDANLTEDNDVTVSKGVGRDWLAQTLQTAGVPVRWLVSYQRGLPTWSLAQHHLALEASSDGSVWCFSSSQAIAFLLRLLPEQRWARGRCIATHPRIADAARRSGFGEICLSRPLLDDVVASLESLA